TRFSPRDFSSPLWLLTVVSTHSYLRRLCWLAAMDCFKAATRCCAACCWAVGACATLVEVRMLAPRSTAATPQVTMRSTFDIEAPSFRLMRIQYSGRLIFA